MLDVEYPVVIPYVHTADKGMELRYTLRGLQNLKEWDGRVFIVGDRESWFKNIIHVPCKRILGKAHRDVEKKVQAVSQHPDLPDNYIWMMDDVYVTEPTTVKPLHRGKISQQARTAHQRYKVSTKTWLAKRGIKEPLDYAVHAPIIFDKKKRLQVSDHILNNSYIIQARSLYGNLFQIGGEYYEDKKTKTKELKEGLYISTQFFTSELDKIFPNKSRFEL